MGKTLQELQRENRRLKNEAESRMELVKIGEERAKLAAQNQKLLKALNRSSTGVAIRKTLGVTGRGFFKAGKKIGSGLIRYGRFLDEAERRNEREARTIKRTSTRRVSSKKATKSSSRRKR